MRKLTAEDRFWAKVEKTPTCWNWTAAIGSSGHPNFFFEGKVGCAHRWAYANFVAPIPAGMQIDHICHNRACVNPEHLRPATNKQNAEYRQGAQRNNKESGVRGVHRPNSVSDKWAVRIKHNGKMLYFGCYETIEEAAEVAKRERARLFTFAEKPA